MFAWFGGGVMHRLALASPWFAMFLVVTTAACDDTPVPTQPSVPPQSSTTGPTGPTTGQSPKLYTLQGRVYDSFFDALVDVPVEVIEGPLTGTVARTDRNGLFTLPGQFSEEITVRASKDGLSPATKRVSLPQFPIVGSTLHVGLELTPLSPPADIAGAYTFSVEVTKCTGMPDSLKVRNYDVTLEPYTNAFSFRMNFSDPNVVEGWGDPTVEIRIVGSRMQINIGDWRAGIIEDFPSAWLNFFGFARATLVDSAVSGSFGGSGGLMYCPVPRAGRGTGWTTFDCFETGSAYCEGDFLHSLKRR
jgi:hypothetical protein